MTRADQNGADQNEADQNEAISDLGAVADDARLMALADGELDAAAAAVAARAIAADPEAARRFAVFAETRARLSAAAAEQDDVPAALRARVAETIAAHGVARAYGDTAVGAQGDKVLRPAFGRRPAPAWALPLAASLALAVGLGAGIMARGPAQTAPTTGFESAAVQDALGRLATGESAATDAGALRVVASFRDGADSLCREAELRPEGREAALGVLCRGEGGQWRPELVLRQPAADGGLSAASGLGALDAFLADIGAGASLDPAAEAAALAE